MKLKKITTLSVLAALSLTVSANEPLSVSAAADNAEPSMIAAVNFTNVNTLMPFISSMEENDGETLKLTADLLDYARTHLGVRYRRGGKTPKGFDCSGFTGHVFHQFGYNLSASSRDQINDGVPIDNSEIQPGDLLFFRGRSSRSIGHVAIAIDYNPLNGEITFIHAAVKGGIRIDKTSSPYYATRFIGARRVIGK